MVAWIAYVNHGVWNGSFPTLIRLQSHMPIVHVSSDWYADVVDLDDGSCFSSALSLHWLYYELCPSLPSSSTIHIVRHNLTQRTVSTKHAHLYIA